MERAVTPETRVFLLCNPQNPLGRVFSADEIVQLAEFCETHDLVLVSDEIHCDLIFDEAATPHFSALNLPERLAQRTITLLSPSKTWNIAGLGYAFAVIPDDSLRRKFAAARGHTLSRDQRAVLLRRRGRLPPWRALAPGTDGLSASTTATRSSDFIRTRCPGLSVTPARPPIWHGSTPAAWAWTTPPAFREEGRTVPLRRRVLRLARLDPLQLRLPARADARRPGKNRGSALIPFSRGPQLLPAGGVSPPDENSPHHPCHCRPSARSTPGRPSRKSPWSPSTVKRQILESDHDMRGQTRRHPAVRPSLSAWRSRTRARHRSASRNSPVTCSSNAPGTNRK